MFCMRCGTMLPNDATFCFKCGFQINNSVKDQFGSKLVYDPRKDVSNDSLGSNIGEGYHREEKNDGWQKQLNLEYQKLLSQKTTFMTIMIILMLLPFVCIIHAFVLWNSDKAELAVMLYNLEGHNDSTSLYLLLDCLVSSIGLFVGLAFLIDLYIFKPQGPSLFFGCFVLFDYSSVIGHLATTMLVQSGSLSMSGGRSTEFGKKVGILAVFVGLLFLTFMVWGCKLVTRLKKAGFFPSKTVNSK